MQLTFHLHRPLNEVFACLTTPELFTAAHPLIERMVPLGDGRYRVHERVPMGPIPYRFRYTATITSDTTENRVTINANVMGLTRITMVFHLKGTNTGTQVTEEVEVRSVLPVKRFMRRLFREQHAVLFRNIEAGLSS